MTAQKLEGKVALITGATSGIGRATALAFAREGARLVLGARRQEEGDAVVAEVESTGGKAVFRKTDVTSQDDVEALVALAKSEFGGLHIAFNNAGTEGLGAGSFLEDSIENFDLIFGVNVRGLWMSMKEEVPAIIESGGGVIINNTSVAGRMGVARIPTYSASKFAVEGLTRSVAIDLAQQGVRVNAIAPGPIKTAMLDRITGGDLSGFDAMIPAGQPGEVEDIAAAAVFLASDESRYITGTSLQVDGGVLA